MTKKFKAYVLNISAILLIYLVLSTLMSTNAINKYYVGVLILVGINIIMTVSLGMVNGFTG